VALERRLDRLPGVLEVRGPGVEVRGRVGGQRVALASQNVGYVGPQRYARVIAEEGFVRRLAGRRVDRGVEAEGEGREEAFPVRHLRIGVEDGGAEILGRVPVGAFDLQVTARIEGRGEPVVDAQRCPQTTLQVVVELAAVVRDDNLWYAEDSNPVPPNDLGDFRC
jgi:hypothetical protein